MTRRRTLHDEEHNEDYYYESDNGRVWYEVERMNRTEELDMEDRITELENDIMVLVLRLIGEDEATFAPETREVMQKYRAHALMILQEGGDRIGS